jgi:hypothetical protein
MRSEIEDKKLKAFLNSAQLESPGADFSARVMNHVFVEKAALEQVKSEPLLEVDTSAVATGYQNFFEKLGAAPLSVAGILLATSVLLFLEKFLSNRSHVYS